GCAPGAPFGSEDADAVDASDAPAQDSSSPEDSAGPGRDSDVGGDSAAGGDSAETGGEPEDSMPMTGDSGDSGPVTVGPCAGKVVGRAVGECAADCSLADASGTAHGLHSSVGRVTVLDFSTMWCPFCKALAPKLEVLHKAHDSADLRVVTILHEDVD